MPADVVYHLPPFSDIDRETLKGFIAHTPASGAPEPMVGHALVRCSILDKAPRGERADITTPAVEHGGVRGSIPGLRC